MKKVLLVFIAMMTMTVAMAQQVTHVIQRGETLESIAQKYQVTVDAIKQANPDAVNMIYVGMRLLIPQNVQQLQNNITTDSLISKNDTGKGVTTPIVAVASAQENPINSQYLCDDEAMGSFNIVYYSFDGFENYGISGYVFRPEYLTCEFNTRFCLEKYGNGNLDLGINYTFPLVKQDETRLFLALSIGPSFRLQRVPDPKLNEKTGVVIEDTKEKFYFDAYSNPRLALVYKKITLSAGVFFWAPELKLEKDKGFQTGVNFALGFDI